MYPYYPYIHHNGYYHYVAYPYIHNPNYYNYYNDYMQRQQVIQGQATWTEGGPVTKCGIAWSDFLYMTAAVGTNTSYQCGQSLKVKTLSPQLPREIIVTVVDQVESYPANKINLHKKAFEALGVNPSVGIINVEIIPSPILSQEKWGEYLLGITQSAYPGYDVIDYGFVEKKEVAPSRIRETFLFELKSEQKELQIRANVIYNPNTNRVISYSIKEVQ
ncbi:DUF3889 domain-containing protein [Bacillus solimangrovi]|uniref:DUF3889 domain-containing protein n=1 Tax=Bacillus solimangrovi TaxID=1305675 RepID=A0A1E5LCZ2_9BACI|nr:DUF3889 domain-containing protein [Bacillus solimangrovi]OEH91958.1 hypothetical protein BFG57_17510 [Bacillus solimangrovi]